MELYNPIIREVEALAGASTPKRYAYDPAEAWEDTGAFELVMLRDAAFELGGSGKSAVNFTCVTSSSNLVPGDEIVVCGPDLDELTGGSLALVVRSRADRLARSVGPDTLPYPLLCDADGVLYDLLDIPTRSGALSTYSLEAWQIMRDAKRRGYHSPANGQQQLPLTLVLDKDGTVLFSHYGASLTDVPADCGAAQSLMEALDVAKPVDVDDADVTIYADPGAAPDIPGLTPHVHEYAQPNLGEPGVFSVFDDAYKDEE